MKKIIKKIIATLGCVALTVTLNSCSKDQEQVAPNTMLENTASAIVGPLAEPPGGCPSGTVWNPVEGECLPAPDPCNNISDNTLKASQRSKAVSLYGAEGGAAFDQMDANTVPTYVYLSNYSSLVVSYVAQIRAAIISASNAYIASVSPTTEYNASTYLSYLNSHLNPLKSTIINDANLTSQQRSVLLLAFTAINDNFTHASNMATIYLGCYPNPANLNAAGEVIIQGWFGSFLKKVVNVVATVVVAVVENSARFAAAFYTVGLTLESAVLGAAVGAIWGLYRGVRDAINGDLVCLIPCP